MSSESAQFGIHSSSATYKLCEHRTDLLISLHFFYMAKAGFLKGLTATHAQVKVAVVSGIFYLKTLRERKILKKAGLREGAGTSPRRGG